LSHRRLKWKKVQNFSSFHQCKARPRIDWILGAVWDRLNRCQAACVHDEANYMEIKDTIINNIIQILFLNRTFRTHVIIKIAIWIIVSKIAMWRLFLSSLWYYASYLPFHCLIYILISSLYLYRTQWLNAQSKILSDVF
jgi:hypothetical protein